MRTGEIEPFSEPRTAANFHEAQSLSSRRLGFSVTSACPLRCGHCSVSASPDLSHTTWRAAFAERVAAQMEELGRAGVRFVDFTGGEPTLAREFVPRVAAAAKAAGMVTGMVTAAHWAASDGGARRTIEQFGAVDRWDISTDVYHLPFVSLDQVRRAFERLGEAGKQPLLRIAHHEPMGLEDARLIDRAHRFAGRRMAFQPIGPVGRGKLVAVSVGADSRSYAREPCPTTGLLIRADGAGAACCAPLSHEARTHPLWYGDAFREPLVRMLGRWRTDWLLQTVRLWGFELVVDWAHRDGVDVDRLLRRRACDLCVGLVTDPGVAASARARSNRLEHKVRVAAALLDHFDEPWADEALRLEAASLLSAD
ncbi:MAG: radical SAM protein [Leptolyngbya sp. PLA1]|nr:radical SAM protein [Leptolyngbya sp. PLA1]